MGMWDSVSRLKAFYERHGFWATIRRTGLAAKRRLFAHRSVLFYCDLVTLNRIAAELPGSLKVERKRCVAELMAGDLEAITSVWNRVLAQRNIRERFEKGASLWLIRFEGKLAGYGWTLRGATIEPHYLPLGIDDVHLFDFHVFTEYRGRKINPWLVKYILNNLAAEKAGRAYIEAAEWNRAQLSSLERTPFSRLGSASKSSLSGRTIVCWARTEQGAIRSTAPVSAQFKTQELRS